MRPIYSVSIIMAAGMLAGSLMVGTHMGKYQTVRDPAAIRQVYDFTHLHGSILDAAVKERLVSGLEIYKDQQGLGIGLGHFAFSTGAGEKVLGCRAYKKITFEFEAEGVAVNGEKPTMKVEGQCQYSSDLTKINPIWIPVARIFGERPGDDGFDEYERPAQINFKNVADYWPRQWVLIGLSVEGESGQVQVDKAEVGQILGRPFTINMEE